MSLKIANLPAATSAHIHGGANAFASSAPVLAVISSSTSYNKGIFVVPSSECWALLSGNAYINIHTAAYLGGELRGQIAFPSLVGTASLSGAQQPSPVASTASGVGLVVITTPLSVNVSLSLVGLENQTMAHLHLAAPGANGGVICTLPVGSFANATCTLTASQMTSLTSGGVYFNIHTTQNGGGELRGQVVFSNNWNFQTPLTSLLSGGNAVPTTLSTASGSGQVVLSTDGTMGMAFLGLSGLANQLSAHIHGSSTRYTSSDVLQVLPVGSFSSFVFPLAPLLSTALAPVPPTYDTSAYFNVHTTAYPAGEVRGQLAAYFPNWNVTATIFMNGAPNGVSSTGYGIATVELDVIQCWVRVSLTLRNLANATVAHVHGGPGGFAGVAPPLVQIAVGNYTNGIFVMTPGACSAITSGNGYINVHTAAYPAGEIRGQLTLYSASVYLSSYQLPTPIQSTATGVGAVVISSWSSLTVSLSLNGVVSQTGASLMSGVWGQAGTSVCSLPTGSFTDYVCSFPNQNTVYDFLDGKLFIYVNTTANPTGELRGHVVRSVHKLWDF